MGKLLVPLIIVAIYFVIEVYVFRLFKDLMQDMNSLSRTLLLSGYWVFSVTAFVGVLFYNQLDPQVYRGLRLFITSFFFINVVSKLFTSLILLGEDVRRLVVYITDYFSPVVAQPTLKSRADFMQKSALIAGALPLAVSSFGIISGAHDYRVRKQVIFSPNLPKAFDGMRLLQISDIHTGSFFNKRAVAGGVDMINAQKADLVVFTGDLVNNESNEAKGYLDIFKQIKAPMGVFSVMGNHDYGDYKGWSSVEAKNRDIQQLHEMHRYMGWDILLNENRIITVDGENLALLGMENWGAGRFSKYGDMAKTYAGTEEIPFKVLLSHDPSHWDAQVRPEYPDIDLTLAGHTHGMQFGVEIGNFRWSPVQYIYKQWADLYKEANQHLYVNRGFGFIGYPGRVGILPEITVIELKSV